MKTIVVDVAAEHGGAKTILEQYIQSFQADTENEYVCLLSTPTYENTKNVRFLNYRWVKKSKLHRLFFDYFFILRIIREEKPDKIFSLQNNAVNAKGINQEVYFHNALFISEKRYSLRESKILWTYQNVISRIVRRSLRRASKIDVQANWIKKALVERWKIPSDIISVTKPDCVFSPEEGENKAGGADFFYPANFSLYKNHIVLLRACVSVWEKYGSDCGLTLHLLGEETKLPQNCRSLIENRGYPVFFHGRLSRQEMGQMYKSTILVYPSYIETVGLPLIECAAFKGKIFAADLEYAHESLRGYDKCVFFDPQDEKGLEELLIEEWSERKNEKG